MTERRYDDGEIARILEGAATEERALVRAQSGGLTLPELERVAIEAGLDPAMVRRSAAALDAPRQAQASKAVVVERELPLPPNAVVDAAGALAAVRAAVGGGSTGSASEAGGAFTWRGQLDGQQTEVSVTPAGARAVVRVHVTLDAVAQASYARWLVSVGGGGGVLAFAALVNPIGAFAALPAAAMVGLGWAMARRDFARRAAAVHARAAAVADAVADAVARAVGRP
jgi:hypothetical protein